MDSAHSITITAARNVIRTIAHALYHKTRTTHAGNLYTAWQNVRGYLLNHADYLLAEAKLTPRMIHELTTESNFEVYVHIPNVKLDRIVRIINALYRDRILQGIEFEAIRRTFAFVTDDRYSVDGPVSVPMGRLYLTKWGVKTKVEIARERRTRVQRLRNLNRRNF